VSGTAACDWLRGLLTVSVTVAFCQLSMNTAAMARECSDTDPSRLARELLELDLSGLRHPSRSGCLDASKFRFIEVFHDPSQDLSGSSFELLEQGDRVEIVSVAASDSVGGHRARFRIQRRGNARNRARVEQGSFDFLIHSAKNLQDRMGCAQMISPPKPWRIWRRCVPQ